MKQIFKKNIGKKEIVKNIELIIGTSVKNIEIMIDDLIEIVAHILVEKKKINIKNFGTFNIIFKKAREGRNPKTKEIFSVNSRNSISFKISNQFKKEINEI